MLCSKATIIVEEILNLFMNYYYIYIYILVDKFSRIYINIIYKSLFVDDANNIFKLFLRKVVRLHGLPKTIV